LNLIGYALRAIDRARILNMNFLQKKILYTAGNKPFSFSVAFCFVETCEITKYLTLRCKNVPLLKTHLTQWRNVLRVQHVYALHWATVTRALPRTEIYEWNNTAIRVEGTRYVYESDSFKFTNR
jgi:hypothetical protein